jgi:hypothetical protein
MRITLHWRAAAAVATAVLLFVPAAAQARPTGPLAPSSGVLLGAWVHPTTSPWSSTGVTTFESQIGRKLAIDSHYLGWTATFPVKAEFWDRDNGRVPMVSWGSQTSTENVVAAINAGSYDAMLRNRADAVKAFGAPIMIRPLWEMNGRWMPWNGTKTNDAGTTDGPAQYVQAWRHIHDIFQQQGATNAVWVWAPSVHDIPKDTWNHWTNYYPGDAYVDWVGMDGYNRGTTVWYSKWQSFAQIFQGLYSDYAARKPIIVTETASCEQGGSKAQWFNDISTALPAAFPDVQALVYFDAVKGCDFRVNSSATSMSAFTSLANTSWLSAAPG